MNKEDTKQAILGFTEFFKGITGNKDLKIPEDIAKEYDIEQEPCEDWYDVPSDEMTLEQARQAVRDLRKKLVEYLNQQPCEDCVSRKDAIEAVNSLLADYTLILYGRLEEIPLKCERVLHDLSPVNPAEKVGQWEWKQYDIAFPEIGNYHCSSCDAVGKNGDNYCSVCGAKMQEVEG